MSVLDLGVDITNSRIRTISGHYSVVNKPMDATYPLIFDGPVIAVGSLSNLKFGSFAGSIPRSGTFFSLSVTSERKSTGYSYVKCG